MSQKLIERLELYESKESFYAVPLPNVEKGKVLRIDRYSASMDLVEKNQMGNAWLRKEFFGIFGIIRLIGGYYLLIITEIEHICNILEKGIYRISRIELIQCTNTIDYFTEQQKYYNEQYLNMIKFITALPSFYFSYEYDLTHTLQNLIICQPDFYGQSLYARSNKEFVWNRAVLHDLIRPELAQYCIPVIHGFIETFNAEVRKPFTVVLISRRNCKRAGTRMYKRGIDDDGNVANYVETEQMVFCENSKASYVIVRGSIPLHWTQRPNLRYKPWPELTKNKDHVKSFEAHMMKLFTNYGKIYLVNLINHNGQESRLFRPLKQIVDNSTLGIMELINFDFHHKCKNDRWDNLQQLIMAINAPMKEMSYFSIQLKDRIVHRQEGVFRVNCIDSLDRTNVVQSLIAKHLLVEQLQEFGAFKKSDEIENFADIEYLYRKIWADNADVISTQYAGTGALKSDFTRTGKRRLVGKLQDGVNALTRYYKNNFEDGFKQDAIDLLLGRYQVKPLEGQVEPSPLSKRQLFKIFAVPMMLALVVLLPILSSFLPLGSWLTLYCCLVLLSFSFYLFFFHGEEFVDQPRLATLNETQPLRDRFNL